MTKQIPLTQGKVALVSDHRYEYLNQWKWHAFHDAKERWYAVRRVKDGGRHKTIWMHREIMTAPKGMEVDHRDSNGLNNTDENLRICTRLQNAQNLKMRKDNISGYKGVRWVEEKGKWRAKIQVNRKSIHLGYFDDSKKAARAYNKAATEHFGEFAKLNSEIDN